jgi:hypothetical protein
LYQCASLRSQALEAKFAAVDLDEFCSLTEDCLKQEDYPNYLKFVAVERYIIKMMSFRPFEIKPKHCNLDGKNFVASDGRGDASDYAITVDKLSVRHFIGGSVPDVAFEDELILYVPDSSTYQGFDAFLFVPQNSAKEARLYAFQITGATDVHEHVASDIRSTAPQPFPKMPKTELCRGNASKLVPLKQEEWAKYCGIDERQVIPVWLTKVQPKPVVGGDLRLFELWSDDNMLKYFDLLKWVEDVPALGIEASEVEK